LAEGRAEVKPAHDAADVQGGIVILSQIWCGALSASQAQRYGFLNGKPEAIELWDRAFPPGPPYIARADWF
jgi:hypothetical protein